MKHLELNKTSFKIWEEQFIVAAQRALNIAEEYVCKLNGRVVIEFTDSNPTSSVSSAHWRRDSTGTVFTIKVFSIALENVYHKPLLINTVAIHEMAHLCQFQIYKTDIDHDITFNQIFNTLRRNFNEKYL